MSAAAEDSRRKDRQLADLPEDYIDADVAAKLRVDLHAILSHLKEQRGEPRSAEDIADELDIRIGFPGSVDEHDEEAARLYHALKRNPCIMVEPDGRFKFYHQLNGVHDIKDWIERNPTGVELGDLVSYYGEEWKATGNQLIMDGSVIAVKETQTHRTFLYPRGDKFLVALSGTVTGKQGDAFVQTSADLRGEVRRGDCVQIGGKMYRVSLRPVGVSDPDVVFALHGKLDAPFSASSVSETKEKVLHGDKGFALEFTATRLPLEPALAGNLPLEGAQAYKVIFFFACRLTNQFGATNDVRAVWRKISQSKANNFGPGEAVTLDNILLNGIVSREVLDTYNHNVIDRRERQAGRAAQQQDKRKRRKAAVVKSGS